MKINTNKGIYFLEQFHAYETYGGLICGEISEAFNRELIKRLSHDFIRSLTPIIIQPQENHINTVLPIHECYAIITSNKFVSDKEAHGSQAAIKWYSDLNFDLKSEIIEVISGIMWSDIAVDFYI